MKFEVDCNRKNEKYLKFTRMQELPENLTYNASNCFCASMLARKFNIKMTQLHPSSLRRCHVFLCKLAISLSKMISMQWHLSCQNYIGNCHSIEKSINRIST